MQLKTVSLEQSKWVYLLKEITPRYPQHPLIPPEEHFFVLNLSEFFHLNFSDPLILYNVCSKNRTDTQWSFLLQILGYLHWNQQMNDLPTAGSHCKLLDRPSCTTSLMVDKKISFIYQLTIKSLEPDPMFWLNNSSTSANTHFKKYFLMRKPHFPSLLICFSRIWD